MSELSRQERVALFASLFRGREDVFARRWEKSEGGVSGYAPAYVDWRTKDAYVPLDVQGFDCLFLVFPFSFEGKLIQYIGRIERGESGVKRVYDYRDSHIAQLESMFKKRQRHYNRRKKGQ